MEFANAKPVNIKLSLIPWRALAPVPQTQAWLMEFANAILDFLLSDQAKMQF